MSGPAATRLRAPLVGRDVELSRLERALAEVIAQGKPQVVSLLGGPGLGKSRLVREFTTDVRARDERIRVFGGSCRQDGPALDVIRRLLRARLAIAEDTETQAAVRVFQRTVTDVIGEQRVGEFLRFLGAYLDLPMPDSPFTEALGEDPEQRRQIARTVLRRFLELDAKRGPLVLTFDDLQWADDDSLELLHYLAGALRDSPILLVVAARPELVTRCPQWQSAAAERAVSLPLAALSGPDAATMVRRLLAHVGEPPDELVDTAVGLAGGNPYLLEQMVRTFAEREVVVAAGDGLFAVDLARLAGVELPLSVEDAISARVAALTALERRLLETAATIGGVFWLGALIALERLDASPPDLWRDPAAERARIAETLASLIDRDYLLDIPGGAIPGETEYAFKHNLEREAIGRYVGPEQRARCHLAIAQWLEFRLNEASEEHCELLATHFERGGADPKAGHYFVKAGERARARYLPSRAADYYQKGLRLLGEGEARTRLEVLPRFGDVLQQTGRSAEALARYESMRRLAYRLDLTDEAASAHAKLGRVHRELGHLGLALAHFEAAHELFAAGGNAKGLAITLDASGTVQALLGNTGAAEHMIREALSMLKGVGDARAIARSHNNLGIVLRDALRYDEALSEFEEALWLWRKVDEPRGVAESLTYMGVMHGHLGDDGEAERLWHEALDGARHGGDRVRESVVLTCLGGSAYRRGDAAHAVELLEQAEIIARSFGDRLQEADTLRSLAKARALIGDLRGAHRDLARAIDLFGRAGSKLHLGVALRTLGEIAGAGDWEGKPEIAPESEFERSAQLLERVGHDLELAHTLYAHADYLEHAHAHARPGAGHHALEVERLRRRARELLERRDGVSIRPSRVPRLVG